MPGEGRGDRRSLAPHLDGDAGVVLLQVLQADLQVQLTGARDDVLPRLLDDALKETRVSTKGAGGSEQVGHQATSFRLARKQLDPARTRFQWKVPGAWDQHKLLKKCKAHKLR